MILFTKPKKAEKNIKGILKNLRADHIGLPTYNHLLNIHANLLIQLEEFDEAELQFKNILEHSKNKILYDPDYRVRSILTI